MKKNNGGVFIISGPSGSGKDTLLSELFRLMPELKFSISCVTRPMRAGETANGKYRFLSRESFLNMIEHDEFLEHNLYVNHYYGTPKTPVLEAIEQGEDMVIEVDVNGAAAIRQKLPDALSIFIMPPSRAVLKERLSGRGTESEETVRKRLDAALSEISRADEFDYIIVNDDLPTAASDLACVIRSGRLQIKRTGYIINEVLQSC